MNRRPDLRRCLRCAVVLLVAALATTPPAVSGTQDRADAVARVRAAIDSVRFVAYTPSDLNVVEGRVHPASKQRIRKDLEILRRDFQGLVTYSSTDGVEAVPAIAAALDYHAVIVGVWDPSSDSEIDTAIALARRWPELVVAVAVGNETLLAERHDWAVLRAALQRARAALPATAVTTSEPFYYYLDGDPPDFIAGQDFLLPSVHPLFQPWFSRETSTAQAIEFVVDVAGLLVEKAGKPVLIKETGLPNGPREQAFSAARQADFWTGLCRQLTRKPGLGVVYFEAFDHDWKAENAREEFGYHPEEGHWGLYSGAGHPRPVITRLRQLWREPGNGYCGLRPGSSEFTRDTRAH